MNARVTTSNLISLMILSPMILSAGSLLGQDAEAAGEPKQVTKSFLVKVSLPITGSSSTAVQQRLRQLQSQTNLSRPNVILEFDTSRGRTGKGSSLGGCIDLARFMMSSEMNRLRLIAFIPGKSKRQAADEEPVQLAGHAVLVALAADDIAIDPDAQFGAAGADEPTVDDFLRQTYRKVVSERLKIPVPVAMAMLDKNRMLFRISTAEGARFVDAQGLKEIEDAGKLLEYETLGNKDEWVTLTGEQLNEFGFVRYRAQSLSDLARRLQIPFDSIEQNRSASKPYVATRVQLPGHVDSSTLQWITRAIEPKVAAGKINMVIFDIDSVSGDTDACLQMARRLAQFDPDNVQTVAYINTQAKGPAALIALCCNHVLMKSDAGIGGEFDARFGDGELEDLMSTAAAIAEQVGRAPAVLQAMLAPELDVVRFRDKTTGEERLMTAQQRDGLDEAENWLPQGPVDMLEPMDANTAYNFGIARQIVADEEQLFSFYQLDVEPELLKPTKIDRWLYDAGMFLASPFVAPWLLFAAMFLLFNEVSQPGLGRARFSRDSVFDSLFLESTSRWQRKLA